MVLLFACPLMVFGQSATSQDSDPVAEMKGRIQDKMASGDFSEVPSLMKSAIELRRFHAGKAHSEPNYSEPDTTSLSPAEVTRIWNLAVDQLVSWQMNCPELPTETPASMLGVFYAAQNRRFAVDRILLRDIATMLKSQQFSESTASVLPGYQAGVFGYVYRKEGEEDCALSGAVQRVVTKNCQSYPEACPAFKSGNFAGYRFLVADQFPGIQVWDSPLSYHMYWAVEEMIQSFIGLQDSSYLKAALLAGDWMLNEKPVVNLSLTAKNIAGLSALYDLTGETKYRDHFWKLVSQCLMPAILMDLDSNRLVDGTNIPFDSLANYSSVPGRIWEASNATSWACSISGMALVNAYAALRDRGDSAKAAILKPYAEAVITNLAEEVVQNGTPPSGSGFRDLSFSILDALWKIDRAEKKRHILWERAASVLWNSGVPRAGGENTVVLGQYLRYFNSEYSSRQQLANP